MNIAIPAILGIAPLEEGKVPSVFYENQLVNVFNEIVLKRPIPINVNNGPNPSILCITLNVLINRIDN